MLYTKELAKKLSKLLQEVDANEIDSDNKFKVIATSDNVDRDWDILTLDGWEIENYLKNPVILANHTYSIENIIWKATAIYQEGNNIIVEWVFSKTNPVGQLANSLYNEWMLKTVSVWFIPKERNAEKITRKELLELSFVAVPANANAVSLDGKTYEQAVEKGLIKEEEKSELEQVKEELSEIKEMIKSLADNKAKQIKEIDADEELAKINAKKQTLQEATKALSFALQSLKDRK